MVKSQKIQSSYLKSSPHILKLDCYGIISRIMSPNSIQKEHKYSLFKEPSISQLYIWRMRNIIHNDLYLDVFATGSNMETLNEIERLGSSFICSILWEIDSSWFVWKSVWMNCAIF